MSEAGRIKCGDAVIIHARVGQTWVDSDARRRNVALARWPQLELPSGGRVIVPLADLELAGERHAEDLQHLQPKGQASDRQGAGRRRRRCGRRRAGAVAGEWCKATRPGRGRRRELAVREVKYDKCL